MKSSVKAGLAVLGALCIALGFWLGAYEEATTLLGVTGLVFVVLAIVVEIVEMGDVVMTRMPEPLAGDRIVLGDMLHLDTVCNIIATLPPDRAVACMAYALRHRSSLLTYEPFGALVIKHARLINRMKDKP